MNPMRLQWDCYDPLWKKMSKEEREEYQRLHFKAGIGYLLTFVLVMVLLGIISLLTGCTTKRQTVSERTDRRVVTTTLDLDSLLHSRSVVRQDSTWRQEILRQFQSIREHSDTSRYVVQDTAGNIVSEKIIINNARETTTASDRQELSLMASRLATMDSTIRSMQHSLQHSDSLIDMEQHETTREVPAQLSRWQTFQIWVGRLVMVALAVAAAVWVVRKRSSWLPWLRKVLKKNR